MGVGVRGERGFVWVVVVGLKHLGPGQSPRADLLPQYCEFRLIFSILSVEVCQQFPDEGR